MRHQTAEEANERAPLYALGALDEEEARLFEAHLAEGCEMCTDEIRSFDSVVASLGDCPSEITPAPVIRKRLEAFLTKEARPDERPATSMEPSSTRMLKIRADEGEWREIAKGIFQKILFTDRQRGTTTSLLKVQPGAEIPSHTHNGIEECVVVEGDIYSDTETFAAGDYLCAPAGSVHEQLFSTHGALLFIVAAGTATI
jgi:anti-sigma factor ChrR (cupin superfamily)